MQKDQQKSEALTFLIKSGKAVFKYMQKQAPFLQVQDIVKSLSCYTWLIWNQIYTENHWPLIFLYMVSSDAKLIYINDNKYPHILSQINHVNFLDLKQLHLYRNCIDNVENLNFLNCPNIQVLHINENYISRITCMNKFYGKYLHIISLNQNPLIQTESIMKSQIAPIKFVKLALEYQFEGQTICQDFSKIIKIKSQKMAEAWVGSTTRIRQQKLHLMIKRRFPNITFHQQINQKLIIARLTVHTKRAPLINKE